MSAVTLMSEIGGELALFAAVGCAVFALDDLAVDLIYFGRRGWRAVTVYSRFPRAFASHLPPPRAPGRLAVLIPAWDESAVIGDMLRARSTASIMAITDSMSRITATIWRQ